jgi:hypothetical protein
MILIILNWIYILVTVFSLGFLFKKLVSGRFGYELDSANAIIFTGLVLATIYAQLFSLVYKVGLVANTLLTISTVIIIVIFHRDIISYIRLKVKRPSVSKIILLIFLTASWCYCTSRGYIHYDSDLYHAQSIRWIEEYGIVKGLGNIHVRFAYNSSFFALQALYSMKFLIGDSLHAVNGFIALLLSTEVIKLIDILGKKRIELSDFARIGAFYYLTTIYSDIVSPATDYTIMCIVFYLVIKWLVLIEAKEKSYVPYSLICVALCYAVTVKLTAGVMISVLIKPAYMLIRDKKWKDIASFIVMGIMTLVPWIVRTVIISGYLLYPYPAIDIFNVDWKIPSAKAISDANEIKTWGRALYNADLVNLGISEWFPNWFNTTLPNIGKIFIILDIICIGVFGVLAVITFVKKLKIYDELLVLGACIASYIFWQTQAPLLRYGYAYVLLTILVTVGILWKLISGKIKISHIIINAMIIIMTIIKALSFANYVYANADQPYYISQKPYGEYELDSYDINGVTFYYPTSGDRVGYDKFPAIPEKVDVEFRGDNISEGFRRIDIQ